MSDRWYALQQPQMFPAIHIVANHAHVNYSIILDDVRWSSGGSQTRTRLVSPDGLTWLSMPTEKRSMHRLLNDIRVKDGFIDVLRKKVFGVYVKAPYFKEVMPIVDVCFGRLGRAQTVADVGEVCLRWVKEVFDFKFGVFVSSRDFPHVVRPEHSEWVDEEGKKPNATQRVANYGLAVGATDYVQGQKSISTYFKPGVFSSAGIRLWGQEFPIPKYPRLADEYSEPMISILDALMMLGVDGTRLILSKYDRPDLNQKEFVVSMEKYA